MKTSRMIGLGSAIVVALCNTGCVIHEGGFRVAHEAPPPPPRPVIHRTPEVVIVNPQPRVVVTPPPPVVVVRPRIVHPEPPPVAPPTVVVVTPPHHPEIPPGHSRFPQTPAGLAKKEPGARPVVIFTSHERDIIHTYVKHSTVTVVQSPGKGHKGLPPGLAKKAARGRDLPPGWQKRCVVGEIMPQEIYRQCEPLPQEVIVKLPPPPPDTIVVTIDTRVVRLARATLEILDVFDVL